MVNNLKRLWEMEDTIRAVISERIASRGSDGYANVTGFLEGCIVSALMMMEEKDAEKFMHIHFPKAKE